MTDTWKSIYKFTLSPTTSHNAVLVDIADLAGLTNARTGLRVTNVGANLAKIKHGSGAQVATTSDYNLPEMPSGAIDTFNIGKSNGFSAICDTGSATLYCEIGYFV